MATNFFSLSPEIRDEIYSSVWADVWNVSVRNDANTAVRALLPWSGPYRELASVLRAKRHPAWIFTSKVFLKEAIAYLQRVSVLQLSISKPHWDADETLDLFNPQILWPCSASQIRTLEIEHKYQVEETWENEPVGEIKKKEKYQMYSPSSRPPSPSNEAPKVPKAQITSLAFLSKFFTTMSSTTSSLRNLTIKIKPGLATEYRNFQVTSVRADQDQDILKLRDAVSPILHQLRRFEIYIGTGQLVGWKFSKTNRVQGRNIIRDAAIAAIQTWADEQVEQANALGMGGLVMGETSRMTEPGSNGAWVLCWKIVWVEGQRGAGEDGDDGEDGEAA